MNPLNITRYHQIGEMVKFYRKERGLTQKELAKRIGKSVKCIEKVESKSSNCIVTLDTLIDISRALEIPLDRFFVNHLPGSTYIISDDI